MNGLVNFVVFRALIAPTLIGFGYWIGTVGIVVGGLYVLTDPGGTYWRSLYGEPVIIAAMIGMLIGVRIACESAVVMFAIHRELVRANDRR